MGHNVQNHKPDEHVVKGVLLEQVGQHSEQASGAEAIRNHVQNRAETGRLLQRTRSNAIDGIKQIAESVQRKESSMLCLVEGVHECSQAGDDADIADKIRDIKPRGNHCSDPSVLQL